jgi:hypothetical protein
MAGKIEEIKRLVNEISMLEGQLSKSLNEMAVAHRKATSEHYELAIKLAELRTKLGEPFKF